MCGLCWYARIVLRWRIISVLEIVYALLFAGDEFRSRLDTLMTQALRKGVPPLFNNLRSLYHDEDKVQHTRCLLK